MAFINAYKNRGGRVVVGSDSGFIFQTYGFGFVRKLEMLQEAGFHPLEALRAATSQGAELLGLEDEIGVVDVGYCADLLIHDTNPLADFKTLYGTGAMRTEVRHGHGPYGAGRRRRAARLRRASPPTGLRPAGEAGWRWAMGDGRDRVADRSAVMVAALAAGVAALARTAGTGKRGRGDRRRARARMRQHRHRRRLEPAARREDCRYRRPAEADAAPSAGNRAGAVGCDGLLLLRFHDVDSPPADRARPVDVEEFSFTIAIYAAQVPGYFSAA